MSGEALPRPTIMQFALVEYAAVRGELPFVQQRKMFRMYDPPELVGAFPGVALYADPAPGGAVAIVYCDEDWTDSFFDDSYASLAGARAMVEREYPGISARWTPSPYTQADLEAAWTDGQCTYCRRRRYETDGCHASGSGGVLCNFCLADALAAELARSDGPCAFCGRAGPFDACLLHGGVLCGDCVADARSMDEPKHCSICARHSDDFGACISNDNAGVVICDGCFAGTQPREVSDAESCSFCGRSSAEFDSCVGNGRVVFCNHCLVELQPVLDDACIPSRGK